MWSKSFVVDDFLADFEDFLKIRDMLFLEFCQRTFPAPSKLACEQALRAIWRRGGKWKRSLQLTSNSPVVLRRLSGQLSDNQHEAETSANVNKNWKTRSKGYDVITNVISANQHFASTFSMQIFKFQRRSCKLSFLLPERFGELARRLLLKDPSAPITTGAVSISIFHLLALSVHIIRPPSLFLGRIGHDRLELQFWILNSSVDVNTLFFHLPQKLTMYFPFSPLFHFFFFYRFLFILLSFYGSF